MQTNLFKAGKTLLANTVVLRNASDLSIAEMANATGVSDRTLRRIEKARREKRSYSPMFSTVVRLAAAAQLTVDEYTSMKIEVQ